MTSDLWSHDSLGTKHVWKKHVPTTNTSWWFQPIWKNISQNWNLPQIGMKIKNIWNHHLEQHSCRKNTGLWSLAPFLLWVSARVKLAVGLREGQNPETVRSLRRVSIHIPSSKIALFLLVGWWESWFWHITIPIQLHRYIVQLQL